MQVARHAPPPRRKKPGSIFEHALVVGLVVALVAALAGWYTSHRTATDLALQGQSLARVNQFQDTGIAVDQAFADFNDAAATRRPLDRPREAFDHAVRAHASQADALRSIIGPMQTDAYLDSLSALRSTVDQASDATHLGHRLTAFSTMKVARDAAVSDARDKRT